MLPRIILALAFITFSSSPHERTVGHHVQFIAAQDGTLKPVLPVELKVERESGEPTTTLLNCDVVAREHVVVDGGEEKDATETVLRCGARTFVVRQIIFTESR